LSLINSHFDEAMATTQAAQKCGIPEKSINELKKSFFDSLVINQQWKTLDKFLPTYEKESYILVDAIWYYEILLKKLSLKENNIMKKQLELFNYGKQKKITLSVESLDTIANHQFSKVEEQVENNKKIHLAFPEKAFNSTLEKKFGNIQSIVDSVVKLRPLGTPKSVLYGYRLIIKSIIDFKQEIINFKPENVSESFLVSFSKGMNEFVKQLNDQKNNYANEATKLISKEKLLSEDALWLKQISKDEFPVLYYYSKEPLLMDRQGSIK